MFSVALILLLAAGSCVNSIDLIQSDSMVVQPGQSLTITCRVSGYSLTDNSYATGWIRQREGKPMDWIIHRWGGGSVYQNNALKNKFSYNTRTSISSVTLTGNNLQPEDTAVYYCVRVGGRYVGSWLVEDTYFDYWGRGTTVTVSSGTETVASPTLFPLIKCNSGTEGKITVGCLAHDFYPKSLTFQWTDASGTTLTSVQYPPAEKNNKYTGVSLLEVSKSDWDSRKSFQCSVTHAGSPKNLQVQKIIPAKVTLLSVPSEDTQALVCTIEDSQSGTLESFKWKKNGAELKDYTQGPIQQIGELYSAVSVLKVSNTDWDSKAVYSCEVTYRGARHVKKASKALITVTLNQPNSLKIFSNNQAELECIITGWDKSIVYETKITWQINGQNQTDDISETHKSEGGQHSKTSTITLSRDEWQRVNNVRCSAIRDDMTPVIQELTVHKGDGSLPEVAIHVVPEEDNSKGGSDEVTLVCLVSSAVLQDYYIAWSEYNGSKNSNYYDGINFPPQKTQHGYSVASVYNTTKEKWDKMYKFMCSAWPAGQNKSMESKEVSKAQDSDRESLLVMVHNGLNCTEDAMEEDELSSLWSTASSFIFLFISSLFYNMIFCLVKMKRQ